MKKRLVEITLILNTESRLQALRNRSYWMEVFEDYFNPPTIMDVRAIAIKKEKKEE